MSDELSSMDAEDDIDFAAAWRVVWGNKFLIVLIAGLFAAVSIVIALTATPIYKAEVVIAEASDDSMSGAASLAQQLGGIAGLAGVDIGMGGRQGRNSLAILKSRRLVEEFITRRGLLPQLFPKAKRPPTLWFAVKHFKEGVISFREDKRHGTTTVAINWTDPVTAALWTNEFVALANDIIRTRAIDDSKRNIAYLNEQITNTDIVELQRVMYRLIESEAKTLMLANGRPEYAFTVVDPAVAPEVRISPRRTFIVLLGGMLGLFTGIVIAFVRDSLARRKSGVQQSSK